MKAKDAAGNVSGASNTISFSSNMVVILNSLGLYATTSDLNQFVTLMNNKPTFTKDTTGSTDLTMFQRMLQGLGMTIQNTKYDHYNNWETICAVQALQYKCGIAMDLDVTPSEWDKFIIFLDNYSKMTAALKTSAKNDLISKQNERINSYVNQQLQITLTTNLATDGTLTMSASCTDADRMTLKVLNSTNGIVSSQTLTMNVVTNSGVNLLMSSNTTEIGINALPDVSKSVVSDVYSKSLTVVENPKSVLIDGKLYKASTGVIDPKDIAIKLGDVSAASQMTKTGTVKLTTSGTYTVVANAYKTMADGEHSSEARKTVNFQAISNPGDLTNDDWNPQLDISYSSSNIVDYIGLMYADIKLHPMDFAAGITDSLGDGYFFGIPQAIVGYWSSGSMKRDTIAFTAGRVLGDSICVANGIVNILFGITEMIAGGTYSVGSGGVGTIFGGLQLSAAGVATIVYNGALVSASGGNLATDTKTLFAKVKSGSSRAPRRPSDDNPNLIEKRILDDGSTVYKMKTKSGRIVEVVYDKYGFPDFSAYKYTGSEGLAEVTVQCTGNRANDFKLANEAAGFRNAGSTSPFSNYTWHHVQNGNKMILVEREVHEALAHTGGFAIN